MRHDTSQSVRMRHDPSKSVRMRHDTSQSVRMRHDPSKSVRMRHDHRRVSECVMTHRRVSHKEIRDPLQQAVKQTQSRSGARFTSGPCTTCTRGLLVAMDPSQNFKEKSAKKNKKRFRIGLS